MTINKIGLSVVATAVLSVTAMAGTISNSAALGLIGQEKLSLADVTISDGFGSQANSIIYIPTSIPATSLKNPVFKFTYTNAKSIVVNDDNLSVFECLDGNESNTTYENWRQVADSPQISGSNNEVISFNAVDGDTYAYNNKKYIIAHSDGADLSKADVNISVTKGSTADVQLTAELYSGDSQALTDATSPTSVAKVGPEYVARITQLFDARIDASNSFQVFYDQYDHGNNSEDDVIINVKRNVTLAGASLTTDTLISDLTFDQNLTLNNYAVAVAGGIVAGTQNDMNVSGNKHVLNAGDDANDTIALTVDGASKIEKTQFGYHAYVVEGTSTFDVIKSTTNNAGAWTIYGYNAQIPNVAGIGTDIETTMKFTNRSGLDADIFFTLIDQDGTIVELSSVDTPEIVNLPKNTTGKYNATDLLNLVTDPEFNKNASFSVEVAIPTTPSAVYGIASFKNLKTAQFSDLPVYNTSTMTY